MHKYYSPQIDRDLVHVLFELKQALHVPMTKLASACIREELQRLGALPARNAKQERPNISTPAKRLE